MEFRLQSDLVFLTPGSWGGVSLNLAWSIIESPPPSAIQFTLACNHLARCEPLLCCQGTKLTVWRQSNSCKTAWGSCFLSGAGAGGWEWGATAWFTPKVGRRAQVRPPCRAARTSRFSGDHRGEEALRRRVSTYIKQLYEGNRLLRSVRQEIKYCKASSFSRPRKKPFP